jgi:hypothetical protein
LKNDALLIGATLTQAQSWLGKRSDDIPEVDIGLVGFAPPNGRLIKLLKALSIK